MQIQLYQQTRWFQLIIWEKKTTPSNESPRSLIKAVEITLPGYFSLLQIASIIFYLTRNGQWRIGTIRPAKPRPMFQKKATDAEPALQFNTADCRHCITPGGMHLQAKINEAGIRFIPPGDLKLI